MAKKKHTSAPKKPSHSKAKPTSNRPRGEKLVLNDSFDTIFGYHAVLEALKNKARTHKCLYATKNALAKLQRDLSTLPLAETLTSPDEITKCLGRDSVHQGLLLQTAPLPDTYLEDIEEKKLVLMLDQVTDPHNIGAIMRSATAFGVEYMITTDRHSPKDTRSLIKAASGAREHISIVRVTNLARAVQDMQHKGYFVIGLDSEAENDLGDPKVKKLTSTSPTLLVLGAEGKGLRRLTREKCDMIARINASGPIVSLNVSNAAALALYELTRP